MASPRTPAEIFNKNALAYQERFMHLALYDDTYDDLCESLKPGTTLLEIGCGPGNITNYLLSKRPDLKILGIDLAQKMIDLAKQNCPSAAFQVMDARNILELTQKFDAIVVGFCLPYLNKEDVAKLISDSARLLNESGLLYLSVIEAPYEKSRYETSSNGQDMCLIYYYEEEWLKHELSNNNLRIKQTSRKNFDQTADRKDTHLIVIAAKA